MARPRTPTNILELKGSFKKDPQRSRKSEPVPTESIGNAPDHFDADEVATWNYIVARCPRGVLGNSDEIAMEMAAVLLAEFRSSKREFPSVKLLRLETLLGKFGMTPADRSKVIVKDGKKKNAFEKFAS